ncbi:putative WD40 repeats [Lyophyllum shimeji]|uniref:WD40 repeats n=1 Tax=Lyophyllum shimeji TaxID=47721 RepID=A0A9P3PSU3_LYOSH|nr:putative WD40 repeats [Lyophyllum shimeji]
MNHPSSASRGPTRNVRLYRASPSGGGAIAKSADGTKCAVAGKESLRILTISDGTRPNPGQKASVGRGVFNNKILTSARNGELIMWDINKNGPSKYERRSKDHLRSINTMSVSHIVHHYCITGSADGDMRVWDLRDMSRSLMRVHHPTSVRSVAFSPSTWLPLHAVVGLDNGSIYRWDLKMGQRGRVDRLPVAHVASVTTLDWCNRPFPGNGNQNTVSPIDAAGNAGMARQWWP